MNSRIPQQLLDLERLRGRTALLFASTIDDESVRMMYECLRTMGKMKQLDLVLYTHGGAIPATHQLALLLREYTDYLSILVPYRARSAGTLLCLSANELILGPMATLGPIDPQVNAIPDSATNGPNTISSEDIRIFSEMAKEWFGVMHPEDRLHVLALVAQRIFPTSLSVFYRYEKMMQKVARELLTYQLPEADERIKKTIIDGLLTNTYAHDYAISPTEAQKLGLHVCFASPQEEDLLWGLLQASKLYSLQWGYKEEEEDDKILGVIASTTFSAVHANQWITLPHGQMRVSQQPGPTFSEQRVKKTLWELKTMEVG